MNRYLLLAFVICFPIGQAGAVLNEEILEYVQNIHRAFEKALEFYRREARRLDLEALFGLRVAEGQE